jgi:glycosyltransferase involved in cell wall biosynthesis
MFRIVRLEQEAGLTFLKWLPHHKLPLLLNKLRLLVLPSVTEGLPNVVLEAMACGTPVLATPVGAIPDIIKEGESGFLLKSNDPKHIAERIIELLNKPDLLEKVSVNAYNYVRENFSFEKTLDAWRKILSEL